MKIATHYFLTHTKYILLNSLKKTMKNLVFDRKFRFPFVHWVLFTYIVGERLKKRWTHITVWTCNWTVIYRSDPVFWGQVTKSMTSSINLKCKLQLYTMSRRERKKGNDFYHMKLSSELHVGNVHMLQSSELGFPKFSKKFPFKTAKRRNSTLL